MDAREFRSRLYSVADKFGIILYSNNGQWRSQNLDTVRYEVTTRLIEARKALDELDKLEEELE